MATETLTLDEAVAQAAEALNNAAKAVEKAQGLIATAKIAASAGMAGTTTVSTLVKPVTRDGVKKQLSDLINGIPDGAARATEILGNFGAAKFSEVKDEDLPEMSIDLDREMSKWIPF